MAKKQVVLPVFLEKYAHHYAETACDLNGYEMVSNPVSKEKNDEYSKQYKKYFQQFCKEAYDHSLTPSGNLKSNPTTPKVPRGVYNELPLTNVHGKIREIMPKAGAEERQMVANQMKSSILSFVNIILITKFGLKVKPDAKGASDFEYNEKQGDGEYMSFLGEKATPSKASMLRAEINRYLRYAITAHVSAMYVKYLDYWSNAGTSDARKTRLVEQMPSKIDSKTQGLSFSLAGMKNKTNRKAYAKKQFEEVMKGLIKL